MKKCHERFQEVSYDKKPGKNYDYFEMKAFFVKVENSDDNDEAEESK